MLFIKWIYLLRLAENVQPLVYVVKRVSDIERLLFNFSLFRVTIPSNKVSKGHTWKLTHPESNNYYKPKSTKPKSYIWIMIQCVTKEHFMEFEMLVSEHRMRTIEGSSCRCLIRTGVGLLSVVTGHPYFSNGFSLHPLSRPVIMPLFPSPLALPTKITLWNSCLVFLSVSLWMAYVIDKRQQVQYWSGDFFMWSVLSAKECFFPLLMLHVTGRTWPAATIMAKDSIIRQGITILVFCCAVFGCCTQTWMTFLCSFLPTNKPLKLTYHTIN